MTNEMRAEEGSYQVILPCEPGEFSTFVASLLGKPKTLKGTVSGYFDIDAKQIINFYHLIQQKVSNQNHGSLINLSISVFYSNGISVTHHNPKDFESYYPTSKAIPTQIVLSFTYLIKFNGKNTPEKQEIDITLSTDRDENRMLIHHWTHSGLCKYTISHTDVTWATDISNIIKAHAESFIERPGKFREFINLRFEEILRYFSNLLFVGILIWWGYRANSIIIPASEISTQLKFIINSSVILCALWIIYRTIVDLITINLSLYRSSFICLIDKDYTSKEKLQKTEGRRWLYYIIACGTNIACGIIATLILNAVQHT